MPSTFNVKTIQLRNETGGSISLSSESIKVFDVVGGVDIATLTTDTEGLLQPAVLSVPVGTKVRFRIENYEGRAGFISDTTI